MAAIGNAAKHGFLVREGKAVISCRQKEETKEKQLPEAEGFAMVPGKGVSCQLE